jgi:hypothetical protein
MTKIQSVLTNKIEEIVNNPLAKSPTCPYCGYEGKFRKLMGIDRHIKLSHPEKHQTKVQKLVLFFTDLLHSEMEEIKLKRKNLAIIIDKNGKECMTPSEWEDNGYNEAVDEVVGLLAKRIKEVTNYKE